MKSNREIFLRIFLNLLKVIHDETKYVLIHFEDSYSSFLILFYTNIK
jgi:hypothetical protein